MFENLKTKNERVSVFHDNEPLPRNFNRPAGSSRSVTKTDEARRLVRCRHCGFICDRDRDANIKEHTFAGFGINHGATLEAGSSKGDAKTKQTNPLFGAGGFGQGGFGGATTYKNPDCYNDREMTGGCPGCGSYMYDPRQPIIPWPKDDR